MDVERTFRRRYSGLLTIVIASLPIVLGACDRDSPAPVGPTEPDTIVRSISVWACGCPYLDQFGSERTIGVLGTSVRFSAAALAEGGAVLYRSWSDPDRFSWSSSAPDVAAVEVISGQFGGRLVLVTGANEGAATITATSEAVSGEIAVTVRDRARPAWSLPLGARSITAGITVGVDGTVYAVSSQSGTTSQLFALSPQGNVLWTVAIPFQVMSTPAIDDDGTQYLGALGDEGSLVAVHPSGTVRWVLEGIAGIRSSPAIGSDGTIYVAGDGHVYAVDPQGDIQWTYEAEGRPFRRASPAIAGNGTIYVGGNDGRLHAINPDGSLRWIFRAGGIITSSPSIGTDGTIYFSSLDGQAELFAVTPDGSERWSLPLNRRAFSSPSIGSDGTVYIGAGGVYAIDPAGVVLWNYVPHNSVDTTPILGSDGTVYVASSGPSGESAIYALDSEGRLRWDYHARSAEESSGHSGGSPAIGVDGTIFSTSFLSSSEMYEGTVHATDDTGSANGGYTGAPWPTERGNRANTGRAGG